MNNIALNILTAAIAAGIDKAGIVTAGKALTLRQWLADKTLAKEPELRQACEGALDYASHLGLDDAEVPAPDEMSGLMEELGFDETIVAALFSIRLAPGDDQMDWDDLIHDLAIRLVGMRKAYEIQTGEPYALA